MFNLWLALTHLVVFCFEWFMSRIKDYFFLNIFCLKSSYFHWIVFEIYYIIAFLRKERMHPNFLSACLQLRKIKGFCEDCKLAAPLGFSGVLGLIFVYICYIILYSSCGFFHCFWSFGVFFEMVFHSDCISQKKRVKSQCRLN